MNINLDHYLISAPAEFSISQYDANAPEWQNLDKASVKKEMKALNHKLESLQEKFYAENKHKLLIILQGMDASGKDGTVRHVFEGVNPQGVKVISFKKPSEVELAHDYLWRIHQQVPKLGQIVIFNRSQYEDVLIVRVKHMVEDAVWKKRYDQINAFEKMLADEGVTILKFFLHISKDEQKSRLLERLDDPEKHWKFNPADLKERARWDEYMLAYQDVIKKNSTPWAPWVIVPANHKWVRNMIVAHHIVDTLHNLHITLPEIEFPDEVYHFE